MGQHKQAFIMNNIILIGMMGSGKTSVGQALSQATNLSFIDTDTMIECRTNMTITHIFQQYGEAYFRYLEAEAAKQAATYSNRIIATGGGIILNPQNMASLKASGFVVYLRCNPIQLYKRTATDHNRPLLETETEPLVKLEKLLSEREHLYTKYSDFIADADEATIDELSRIILTRILCIKRG